jgi:hypothetical protein
MFESKINRGRANGYAPLNGDGKVGLNYLPDVVGVAGTSGTSGRDGSQGSSGATGTSGTSGTSPFAGVNTGSFATTGSNIFRGNQSISGSVHVSSSLVVAASVVSNGSINALNSDLIINGGDIVLSGSFAQQVNYAPFGSGSWETQANGEVTELDITKDIHLIDITDYESQSNFYLPNGLYDGQVIRFALKGNGVSSPNTVWIWMDNLRTYNGSIQSNTTWSPFWDNGGDPADNPRSLATAVYIDGAWNIDSDWWGMY